MVRAIVVGLLVVLGVWIVLAAALFAFGRRAAARELLGLIPNLVMLFCGLLGDPRVPRSSKLWLGVAVLWFVSPIDLIPEFIPVLGPLDDAIVAALVLRHVLKHTDRAVLSEHWRGSPETLDLILRRRGS